MNYVAIADLHLWARCRRQWYSRCIAPDGTRRAAIPEGMTGESSLRESARAASYGRSIEHRELPDVWAASIGREGGDPVFDSCDLVTNPDRLRSWITVTTDAFAAENGFRSGIVEYNGLCVAVDAARYRKRLGSWEFFLYRAATGVRGAYLAEGSALAYVLAGVGIPFDAIHLLYLNKKHKRDGDDKPIFVESNIETRSLKNRDHVYRDLERIKRALDGEYEVPADYVCRQACRLCVPSAGEEDLFDVGTLHKGAQTGRLLKSQGVLDIRSLPVDGVKLSPRQKIQVEAVTTGSLYTDRGRLSSFLESIEYPQFFLDFEAYAPSLAPFSGLGPYEHTPVIASIHARREPTAQFEHAWFAAEPGRDQRGEMFAWLKRVLGDHGSIVVFGKGFEAAMIAQLARVADRVDEGTALARRFVDLLTPFVDFLVYDPRQLGKVSLKRVLPVYTSTGYEEQTVQDGMHANLSYTRRADEAFIASGADTERTAAAAACAVDTALGVAGEASKVAAIDEIAAYCSVDTIAMARLLDRLAELALAARRWTPLTD